MARFIDRTGQTFNHLTIIKELGGRRVIAKCSLCGNTKNMDKSSIVTGKSKSCGCVNRLKNTVGQTFGNFTVLEELGNKSIKAKCNLCGTVKDYGKTRIIRGYQESCGCLRYNNVTGEKYGNFYIIKDLGNSRVIAKCLLCGSKKEYDKYEITTGKQKACGCLAVRDVTGEQYGDLKVIKELGRIGQNTKVICECLKCGHIDEYYKGNVVRGNNLCKKCGKLGRRAVSVRGETFGNLLVIKELPDDKIICKCLDCGKKGEYIKRHVKAGSNKCRYCNVRRGFKGRIINSLEVLKFEYTGRNGKRYFTVSNINTGETYIMNREEILGYKANKQT